MEDNIKINLEIKIGRQGLEKNLARYRDNWLPVVQKITNFEFHKN